MVRSYDEVSAIESDIDTIHSRVDEIEKEDETLVNTVPERPEGLPTVFTKFRVKADIPKEKKKYFDGYGSFYGTHVAYSNSPRKDNLRHLFQMDLCQTYEKLTYVNHSSDVMIKETSEFQMTRGNEEVGGFEARLGYYNVIRQDANIRRNPIVMQPPKKKRFLGVIPIKRKSQPMQGVLKER